MSGDLDVADLPSAWDAKMQRYLGRSTQDDYRDGCMQDVHWYCGLFGYFPTYTLGAVIAAQLFAAIRQHDRAAIDGIKSGDFAPLLAWLRRNVHGRGRLVTTDQLLLDATGSTLNTQCIQGAFVGALSGRLSQLPRDCARNHASRAFRRPAAAHRARHRPGLIFVSIRETCSMPT